MTTLIKNIGLCRNGKVTENQNISLDGKYIKDFPESPKDEDYTEVIDGKGMLAMPGLVNTHTHVAMTLFRSYADDMELMDWLQNKIWPAEDHLDDDIVYWGSMLAFAEMIRGGTTAFCDMYMFMDSCARRLLTKPVSAEIWHAASQVSARMHKAAFRRISSSSKNGKEPETDASMSCSDRTLPTPARRTTLGRCVTKR